MKFPGTRSNISYFDFINHLNHFDFKYFGLILIWKFKFLLKTKFNELYMKKCFVAYGGG